MRGILVLLPFVLLGAMIWASETGGAVSTAHAATSTATDFVLTNSFHELTNGASKSVPPLTVINPQICRSNWN